MVRRILNWFQEHSVYFIISIVLMIVNMLLLLKARSMLYPYTKPVLQVLYPFRQELILTLIILIFLIGASISLTINKRSYSLSIMTRLVKRFSRSLYVRLGAEVCYLADFGSYKDANGYLVANGSVKLHDLLSSAPQCPLENVVTLKDVNDELEDFVYNGF